MKEQRHRILCAVCALALVLTAVLAPAAWAADGAGEVQDTAKPLPCFAAHDDSASTAIALLNRQSSRYILSVRFQYR